MLTPTLTARHGLLTLLLPALTMGLLGCEFTPAQYQLPTDGVTAVLVDDPAYLMLGSTDAIATRLVHDLSERTKATLLPVEPVVALRHTLGEDAARTPIDQIGRALGADRVLHVEVREADTDILGGVLKPRATAAVKVIDVATSRRLFPESASGQRVAVALPTQAVEADALLMAQSQAKARLAQKLGREVGRLFYRVDRFNPREIDPTLGDMNTTSAGR